MRDTILASLQSRYATKRFDPSKRISDADWNVLAESLRLAPSSYGLQPWKFILVKNPSVRTALRAVSWNQPQVEEASHYVVLASLKTVDEAYVDRYVAETAKIRSIGTDVLAGYRDMMVQNVVHGKSDQASWTARQAYIAMGFAGFSAALLGIDSCMMEGFDPREYDRILGLEGTPYASVASIALGYRSGEDATASYAKSRFSAEDVFEER